MGRHSSDGSDLFDPDWRSDRLGAARRGENPMVLAQMRSGYAVIGDTQFLPGYCVLLSDVDGTGHLTDLARPARADFLLDMSLLGEAVLAACNAMDPSLRRLNYEILGNTDTTYLHAHVFPRYGWEPEELLVGPVWAYPRDRWTSPRDAYAEEHEPLREAITTELLRIMADAYGVPAI
jgi:diadenosine tetraphosphate (Ap4A) HIT family hydrolase